MPRAPTLLLLIAIGCLAWQPVVYANPDGDPRNPDGSPHYEAARALIDRGIEIPQAEQFYTDLIQRLPEPKAQETLIEALSGPIPARGCMGPLRNALNKGSLPPEIARPVLAMEVMKELGDPPRLWRFVSAEMERDPSLFEWFKRYRGRFAGKSSSPLARERLKGLDRIWIAALQDKNGIRGVTQLHARIPVLDRPAVRAAALEAIQSNRGDTYILADELSKYVVNDSEELKRWLKGPRDYVKFVLEKGEIFEHPPRGLTRENRLEARILAFELGMQQWTDDALVEIKRLKPSPEQIARLRPKLADPAFARDAIRIWPEFVFESQLPIANALRVASERFAAHETPENAAVFLAAAANKPKIAAESPHRERLFTLITELTAHIRPEMEHMPLIAESLSAIDPLPAEVQQKLAQVIEEERMPQIHESLHGFVQLLIKQDLNGHLDPKALDTLFVTPQHAFRSRHGKDMAAILIAPNEGHDLELQQWFEFLARRPTDPRAQTGLIDYLLESVNPHERDRMEMSEGETHDLLKNLEKMKPLAPAARKKLAAALESPQNVDLVCDLAPSLLDEVGELSPENFDAIEHLSLAKPGSAGFKRLAAIRRRWRAALNGALAKEERAARQHPKAIATMKRVLRKIRVELSQDEGCLSLVGDDLD